MTKKLIALSFLILSTNISFAQKDNQAIQDSLFTKASKEYEKKDYKASYITYSALLDVKETDYAFYNRGLCSYYMQDYKAAISNYTKSIEFGRYQYDVYYGRALCNFMLTHYELATSDFDISIELKSDYNRNYTYKGACFYYLGRYNESLSLLNKVANLQSDFEPTYYYRCMVKYYLNDYAGSLADCNVALSMNKYYDTYFWRGLNYLELKRCTESIVDYDTVIAKSPKYATALERG